MKRQLIFAVMTAAMVWPLTGVAQTVNIDNGVVGDGELNINVDVYGSYGNFNAAYVDSFQPTASAASAPTFSAGFRLFSGTNKVLLSDMPEWENAIPALDPETWITNITTAVSNVDSATASGSFSVCTPGGAPLLSMDVTSTVSADSAGVAVLDQTYDITNDSGGALDFGMNRVLDADLVWDGDFLSDHVSVSDPLGFVGQHEPGSTTQAMALTSGSSGAPHDFYWGAKNTHTPTGGLPAMGFGTDFIQWANNGLPASWENYIAFSGYSMPGGDSGLDLNDGHIGLHWNLSLADGESTSLTVTTVYGALSLTAKKDCLLGDVDQDGAVTLLDVDPFVALITSGMFQCEADVNEDGAVDLLDVDGFVAILTGG